MKKKRVTQIFPFLIPIRKLQRKIFFYIGMKLDSNRYSKRISNDTFEYKIFFTKSKMINPKSGFDIKYQINKVDNLKLVANTINKIVIEPGETFSFWILARKAEKYGNYKDGLAVQNDKVVNVKGGGLCQISNLLFWVFLHTPLTIVERHPHSAETLPSPGGDIPEGVDATIAEGWKDLKVKNDTDDRFQILIEFDEEYIYGSILSDTRQDIYYRVKSENLKYTKENGKIYRYNEVYKLWYNSSDNLLRKELILKNKYEIQYDIESELGIIIGGD